MNSRTSAALAWGGVLLAGVLWGVGALVAQSVLEGGGMSPFSLSLARFALGLPLLWWWHWRQVAATPAAGQWRNLPRQERALVVVTGLAMAMNVTCWFMGQLHRCGLADGDFDLLRAGDRGAAFGAARL